MTGKEVLFESELTHSNVICPLPEKGGQDKVVRNEKGGQDKVVKNEKSALKRAEKEQGTLVREGMPKEVLGK